MRVVIMLLLAASAFSQTAGTLAFSPQGGKKVTLWAVSGCFPKAIPSAQIYQIATAHGLTWLTPTAAATAMQKRTTWGKIARYGGLAAAGAASLLTLDVIKSNPQIQQGVGVGSSLFNVLLPLVQQQVPTTDPAAGQSLAIGPDGCGTALFYAAPGPTGPFIETLK